MMVKCVGSVMVVFVAWVSLFIYGWIFFLFNLIVLFMLWFDFLFWAFAMTYIIPII